MASTSFHGWNSGTQLGDNSGTVNINNHLPPDSSLPDLPCVPEAIFNHSKHEDEDQLQYCHDDTRQELLQTIYTWVGNSEGKAFLLSGWPGTGKTTIARTVAKNYRDQNVSFMFQKGNGDCGSFRKFVTTVAIQLIAKSPHIKKSVHDALRSDPSILDQGIEDQWSRLVLEPLEHLPDPATPYVLVIDALDECVNGEWLLDKLLQKRPSGLRIFITSRPHLLRPNINDSRYHHVVLHDLDPDIVNQDILRFLQMTLEKRRPGWPDKNSLKLLVCRANGIFEWAALASRFLNQSDGVYESRLQRLLGDGESHLPQEEMNSLYLTILREYVSLQNWETDVQSTCCSLLRHYLGSLVVLFDQLPPRSLYRVIPREAGGPDIHEILGNLGSILDFPSDEDNFIDKIRIHHPTFREFLLDRERCTDNKFYVEKKQAHKIVLGGCLDLLLSTLKRDISQTESSIFLDYDAGQSHTRQALLPEIQYACLYWVAHLTESGENVHGNDTISRLLFKHSLHWLEVLGCMGRSLDALIALERLSSLAKCDENSEVFKFIADLTLFTRHHRNLIDEHPRQLYISGLIFAPTGSLVRRRYSNEALGTVQYLPKTPPQWPYCFLQSLEGHNDDVQALAFSDRRTILASASSDFTIILWNTLTGETLRMIKGFQYPITAISFSKEGKEQFLASLSDRVVQIWDVRTGCCVYTLPNPQGYKAMTWINDQPSLRVISYDCIVEYWSPDSESSQRHVESKQWVEHGTFLTFSGDTMTFATWSDVDPIHIWRISGDFCSEKIALDYIGESRIVSLSYDGALVATAEKRIRIYDTNTGNKLFSLEGDLMHIRALAFAPNSRLLASGSNDRTVRLWSLTTKQCLQKLEGHRLPVISLSFYYTSDILASGSKDATVRLWDISTFPENDRQHNPQEDLNKVTTLAVAEDGQIIAVGFSDSCINLYHVQNEKGPMILQFHEGQISDLHFLEDGKTLASASFDGTIQLWDTVSGQHLKTFVQYPAAIQGLVFTDDHEMLASILLDFTISTWTVKTEALPRLIGHTSYVQSAVFLQPDYILASSSRDKTIRIWDIVDGVCLRTLKGHEHWVNNLAFSQDGNTLASTSPDNTVRLWDIPSGDCLRVIAHSYGVEAVAFSRDQSILASISRQGMIRIWDISQSMDPKKTLILPPSPKIGLTSTGQYLITDRGSLALDMDPQGWKPWEQPRSMIYVGREWILNGTQRVLWIPPSYRNRKFLMVRDKTVIFVGNSGETLVLRFR